MKTQKKSWEKPQLIILARGTPAEILTTGCKVIGVTLINGADNVIQDGCARLETNDQGQTNCGACQARNDAS